MPTEPAENLTSDGVDVKLFWDRERGGSDIAIAGDGALASDDSLETSVILSIFSDARRLPSQPSVDIEGRKGGWWGQSIALDNPEDEWGSRIWLLDGKLTDETLLNAQDAVEKSLEWITRENIASSVTVTVDSEILAPATPMMVVNVDVRRGDVLLLARRYRYVWEDR